MSSRARFEGLLQDRMKQVARQPLKPGEKAMIENKRTFREGFKCSLQVLGVIEESTTELNDKQMDVMVKNLDILLGNSPPDPDG